MDHDALFKMLLKTPEILRGFFLEFLPEVWRFIDSRILEFPDKERHTIRGRKRTGDILIKTRFRDVRENQETAPDRSAKAAPPMKMKC